MIDHYPSRTKAAAEWLPRQEPVVHGHWSTAAPISRQQADQFDKDGYLVLEGLFSSEEIALLQKEAGALLADPEALDGDTVITEPGGSEIRSIFEIHRQSKLMERLAADERLSAVAGFLLDDQVYLHQSRLNYKPGFLGREFYWHSDFETWHVEDGMPHMRALSMSILLADNSPHNGPLMLIPGSHLTYVSCVGETPNDHYRQSLKKQEYGVPDEDSLCELAHAHGIVAPIGPAGTVILFDCNLMHGSNGNITPFPRANAFLVYNAVSNRLGDPYGPAEPRPSFIACRDPQALTPRSGMMTEGPA